MLNLGKIAAVTISTSDLNRIVEVYQEFLKYRITKSGQITEKESSAWGTENITNADYVVMQPEKSSDFSFRFILSRINLITLHLKVQAGMLLNLLSKMLMDLLLNWKTHLLK